MEQAATTKDTEPATVALTVPSGGRFVDSVQEALPDEVVVSSDDPRAEHAEILAVLSGDDDAIRRAVTPNVRWIHALKAGVDGFPFDTVGDRWFTCSRGATAVPIAEWTMAMVLAHAKRLPDTWVTEAPDVWGYTRLGSVAGATLGLVGVGAIGTEIARRALAFEMEVVGYRRRALPAPVDGMTIVTSLPELLTRADHIVVAAPATSETHHLIGVDELAVMQPTAHLINIARGTLLDQDALLAALDADRLAAASLDVTDPEPLPAGHALYGHPKVRLSPHISWAGPAGISGSMGLFVENVRRYRAGESLHGLVDVAAGY